jgi:hypothetical protein
LPSDGSTDTENSGEEGKVIKNLGKEMTDQPHVIKNTDKHGKKNQPLKEIIVQLTKKITEAQVGKTQTDDTKKQEPCAEEGDPNGEDDGQDKSKDRQVDTNQSDKITAIQVDDPSGVEEEPSASDEETEPNDAIKNSDNDVGSDDETATPSEPKQSNKITAEQDDEPQTEDTK